MTTEDDIGDIVERAFGRPHEGDVASNIGGDWRIDRIDGIIQEAYDQALWWHNNRISEGCDERSGLRGLPYVPWDERIDGVAAMQGGSIVDAQPRQLPGNATVRDLLPPTTNEAWVYTQGGWRRAEHVKARSLQAERKGSCLVIAAILALVGVCGWAIIYSTIGG